MADDVIIQRIILEGSPEVRESFAQIEEAGTKALEAINTAAEQAASGNGLGALVKGFAGLAAAAAATGVALFEWAKRASTAVDEMNNLAVVSGQTITEMSTLSSALTAMGASGDNLGGSFRRMSLVIQQAWREVVQASRDSKDKQISDNLAVQASLLAIQSAQNNLADARKKLLEAQAKNGDLGAQSALNDLNSPDVANEEAISRAKQGVQKATLAIAQAEEAARLASKKATQDRLNDINNVKAAIDQVAGGFATVQEVSSKANLDIDNVLKGVIASAGPAGDLLKNFSGNIGELARQAPGVRETFLRLADFMHNSGDAALNTALAYRVLGRSVSADLIAAMSEGSAAIKQHEDELRKFGLVLSDADAFGATEFVKALHKMSDEIGIIFDQIGIRLLGPSFTAGFKALSSFIEDNRQKIQDFAQEILGHVTPIIRDFFRLLVGQDFSTFETSIVPRIAQAFVFLGQIAVATGKLILQFFEALQGKKVDTAWVNVVAGALIFLGQMIVTTINLISAFGEFMRKIFGDIGVVIAAALVLLGFTIARALVAGIAGALTGLLVAEISAAFAAAAPLILVAATGLGVLIADAIATAKKTGGETSEQFPQLTEAGLQTPGSADRAKENEIKTKITVQDESGGALESYQQRFKTTVDIVGKALDQIQKSLAEKTKAGVDSANGSLAALQDGFKSRLDSIDAQIAQAKSDARQLDASRSDTIKSAEDIANAKADKEKADRKAAEQRIKDLERQKQDIQAQQQKALSGGDTQTDGIKAANDEAKNLGESFRSLNDTLKNIPGFIKAPAAGQVATIPGQINAPPPQTGNVTVDEAQRLDNLGAAADKAAEETKQLTSGFDEAGFDIKDLGTQASTATTGVNDLGSVAQETTSVFQGLASAINGIIQSVGSSGNIGFAEGGLIHGPGTGTSDSIIARVSRGEHIQPAAIVAKPGVLPFLEMLRVVGDLPTVISMFLKNFKLPGFSTGGLVDGIRATVNMPDLPRFASGGIVGGDVMGGKQGPTRTLNLTIDGQTFGGLTIPEKTAQALERHSVFRQVASAGVKPRYYR